MGDFILLLFWFYLRSDNFYFSKSFPSLPSPSHRVSRVEKIKSKKVALILNKVNRRGQEEEICRVRIEMEIFSLGFLDKRLKVKTSWHDQCHWKLFRSKKKRKCIVMCYSWPFFLYSLRFFTKLWGKKRKFFFIAW